MPHFRWPDKGSVARGVAYAFLVGAVTLGLLSLAWVINVTYFNDPSVRITNLHGQKLPMAVCPGQVLEVKTRITVERPLILFSYFSVMDEGLNHSYNGTQVANGPRPHPHAATFTQSLAWMVPDLAPGVYSRVLAYRGTDGRENSLFTWTEFEIGKDC